MIGRCFDCPIGLHQLIPQLDIGGAIQFENHRERATGGVIGLPHHVLIKATGVHA